MDIEQVWKLIPKSVMSVGLLSVGVLFCFFGLRLFRPTMALTGAIAGALLAYSVVQPPNSLSWQWLVVVGAAIGVAGLCSWLWSMALLALGGLSFLAMAGMAMSWIRVSDPVKWAIMGVSALVGAFMALALQRPIVIGGTALVGAMLMGEAGDIWWDWGLRQAILKGETGKEINPWLLIGIGGFTLFGALFQWSQHRKQQQDATQNLPK